MKGVLYHSEHFFFFYFLFFPPLQLNSRSCIICCHHSQGEAVDVTAEACWEEGARLHPELEEKRRAACPGCCAWTPPGEAAGGTVG